MDTLPINLPKTEIYQFCQKYYICRLALFGSVLRDDFTINSDIDVLVEFEAGKTPGLEIVRMALRSKRLAFFLLFIISCVFMIACNAITPSASTHYDERPLANQQTRTVKHTLGEVEVPLNPQRIVTINPVTLEAILALGIQPIGGSHWDWKQPYLQGKIENIQDVGWIPHVNLEKVAALNPDFIIGSRYQRSIYDLLSQIAPTYLAEDPPQSNSNWELTFLHIAEGLNRTEMAAQVMTDYDARLKEFKQKMGDRHKEMKVSVAALFEPRMNKSHAIPASTISA